MAQKEFFRERTVAEIRRMNLRMVYRARGLVERIDDLDFDKDAVEVRVQLIPGRFYRNVGNSAGASRKALKHGERGGWIKLPYPETEKETFGSSDIPLRIRERAFAQLGDMKEENIFYVGYYEQPNWGDRRKIVYPFAWMPESVKLFAYAENLAGGIKVNTKYQHSGNVWRKGAEVPVEVPSRTEKQDRYKYKLIHVPLVRSPWNLSTVLRMRPVHEVDERGDVQQGRTEHERFLIRYPWPDAPEEGNVVWRYPQDGAAYYTIFKKEWQDNHNITPLEMNPFSLFGKRGARFYDRLKNNVLVFDPTLKSNDKLRKLHIAEASILWARAIGRFGFGEFGFWDWERDGALRDYWKKQ